ncbi:hypothetical protein BEWA_014950 [Theileria equi strain WA]|uniref:Uncharacterized protein n=1 Tax=Theileria equi strain WA TaxID=1537102 RepID=L1LC66_THEEQ|nr:hypothetical protein BEWA_014950 [Theileria equi strain WA]EKX72936.1 hypothetical protein BEWA_014950 [Theileria equi strain WA]|eukprot:XP_004832388.1 hypothetical protein BEWA_014950 [Theileria equi strain WA]
MDLASISHIYKYINLLLLFWTIITISGIKYHGKCGSVLQDDHILTNYSTRGHLRDVFPEISDRASRITVISEENVNNPGTSDTSHFMCNIDKGRFAFLPSSTSKNIRAHNYIAYSPQKKWHLNYPGGEISINRVDLIPYASNYEGILPIYNIHAIIGHFTLLAGNRIIDDSDTLLRRKNFKSITTKPVTYPASDITVGLVKVLRSHKVITVKSFFEAQFGINAVTDKKYADYTATVSKILFDELSSSGYDDLSSLFYHKFKTMDNAALSRGYRILFLEHIKNGENQKLLKTFVDIFHDPFLADVYVHEAASSVLRRTYIDGWILSLIFLSTLKYLGVEFLKRTLVFQNFKENFCSGNTSEHLSQNPTMSLSYEVKSSEAAKRESLRKIYDNTLISCFDSRHFKFFISLYCDKLSTTNSMDTLADKKYKCNFDSTFIPLDLVPNVNGKHTFEDLLDRSLCMSKKLSLTHISEFVREDMSKIPKRSLRNMDDISWISFLMLRHSLHNIFLSLEIPIIGNPSASCTGENSRKLSDLLDSLSNLTGVNQELKEYYHILSTRVFFKRKKGDKVCSVGDFMARLNDLSTVSEDDIREIDRFINAPLHLTFFGNPISSTVTKKDDLGDTIHKIRDCVKNKKFDVHDIYIFMRALLDKNMSGSAAASMLFILIPNLTFLTWTHFHLFVCAFEHDIETNNADSLSEVLDLMIKMGCRPEPVMYARFFNLCNITKKVCFPTSQYFSQRKLIWNHFHNFVRQDYRIYPEVFTKYGIRNMRRVSLDMYNSLFEAAASSGMYREGLIAFKKLLEDLEGLYQLIPFSSWNFITRILNGSQVDSRLISIVYQCTQSSVNVSFDNSTHLPAHIPTRKSVLAGEIISMLDKHLNKL